MRRVLLVLCLLVLPRLALAAGTCTSVVKYNNVYTITCTSDGSGNLSAHAFTVQKGTIKQVRIVPGTSGVQPSNLYDVTLKDAKNIDVLDGAAGNLSQTNAFLYIQAGILTENVKLDVQASGMGSAKNCTVEVWVVPNQ